MKVLFVVLQILEKTTKEKNIHKQLQDHVNKINKEGLKKVELKETPVNKQEIKKWNIWYFWKEYEQMNSRN